MYSITSPLTGAAISGLTSPTFTFVEGKGPTLRSKQYSVSNLGGTQTGVSVHSIANPFTLTFTAPTRLRALPAPNPQTGVVKSIPTNVYKQVARKGVVPYAGAIPVPARAIHILEVPAGAETNDPTSLKSLLSMSGGAWNTTLNGIFDTAVSGEA